MAEKGYELVINGDSGGDIILFLSPDEVLRAKNGFTMENSSEGVVERVEQVTSTGTSWIVRRSKSHGGQIYYFNTFTGEALWNLSEAEMERARRSTKKITDKEDVNMGACPEPKEPPTDQQREPPTSNTENSKPTTSHNPSPSRIYNKQIINNQFPKQQFPIASYMVPSFMPNMMQNPIGNGYFPIAMNPSNANYTPNMFSVPPPPIVYNPNLPVINHTPPNVQFNHQSQPSTSVHFNNQNDNQEFNNNTPDVPFNNNAPFDGQEVSESIGSTISPPSCHFERRTSFNAFSNKQNKKKGGQRKKKTKINLMNNDFDLRKLLSAKKLQKQIHSDNEEDSHNNWNSSALSENELDDQDTSYETDEGAQSEPEPDRVKEPRPEADDDWIEENFYIKDGRIRLDVTNLKNLRKPFMDMEQWYIVADKDFLLNHLIFLNILCNSDDECCLMVPRNVLAELQEAKDSPVRRTASRAKRAVSFLLQRSEGINVSIGDANCDETDTRCDYLLNCCTNLLEDNYHVVLLSNDVGFQSIKNSSQVPVFNIRELKQVLTNTLPVKKDRLKPPPCVTAKPIKITVKNDAASTKSESVYSDTASEPIAPEIKREITPRGSKEIQCNMQITNQDTGSIEIKTQMNSHAQTSDSSKKQTSETGVQTEVIETNECHSHNTENSKSDNTPIPTVSVKGSKDPTITANNNRSGKRDIRLNRSISVKTTSEEETPTTEKKQFRWRRKRLASGSCPNDGKVTATNSNKDETNTQQKEAPTSTSLQENNQNEAPKESLFNEVSSFKNNTTANENATVDETSTSGVVSNMTSYVDSESESGKQPTETVSKQPQLQNNIMFEVQDQNMENSLRLMKEEWLSRFLQIMEEVLTQILRQDEVFLKESVYKLYGGGPWSILEAANCIKIKFKDNCDITDAADKLSTMLAKITDATGRIIDNLEPSEYMEMYSYGVYLVKTLESALSNCEDLNIASQSLLKLLDDIKNANLDTNHDSFEDRVHPERNDKQFTPVSQSPKVKEKTPKATPSPKKPKTPPKAVEKSPGTEGKPSEGSYNLRARQRTPNVAPKVKPRKLYDKQSTEQPIQIKRTINQQSVKAEQDSFFSNLNLVKKDSVIPESANTPIAKTISSQDTTKNISDRNVNRSEPPPNTNVNNIRVVRNFTIRPEYEKRADETEKPMQREPLDMDQLDYSGFYENEEEHFSDDAIESQDQNKDSYVQNYVSFDQNYDRFDENNDRFVQNKDRFVQNYDRCDQNNDAFDQNYDRFVQHYDLYDQNYDHCVQNYDPCSQNYDSCDRNYDHRDQNFHHQDQNIDQFNESRNEMVNYDYESTTETTLPQINGHSLFASGTDRNFINDSPFNVNNNLNCVFYSVIASVRESFLDIQAFCEETVKELSGPVFTAKRKCELYEKAEGIQIKIENLCKSLNSIYCRETYKPDNNIQALLRRAGINGSSSFSDNHLAKYRDVIGNCLEKAKVLQDSVAAIVSVVNRKPIR